jgi:hypothetical protein
MKDFDPALRFSDDLSLFRKQCAYHRITNKSVFGLTDAHINFGIDLLELVGQSTFDIGNAIEDVIKRDTWVTNATATVDSTIVDGETEYDIGVVLETVDNVTLELKIKAAKGEVTLL